MSLSTKQTFWWARPLRDLSPPYDRRFRGDDEQYVSALFVPDPILEQHAHRGDEGERLVEHDVVLRLGHFDDRCLRPHQLRHVAGGLARDERTLFAEQQRGPATHILQVFAEWLAEAARADRRAVELPGPAFLDLHQRMAPDVFDEKIVIARLRWHQPEARQARLEARIDFLVAPVGRRERMLNLLFRRANGRVDDYGAAQHVAERGGELRRHEAAEAVADHEWPLAEPGVGD